MSVVQTANARTSNFFFSDFCSISCSCASIRLLHE